MVLKYCAMTSVCLSVCPGLYCDPRKKTRRKLQVHLETAYH